MHGFLGNNAFVCFARLRLRFGLLLLLVGVQGGKKNPRRLKGKTGLTR